MNPIYRFSLMRPTTGGNLLDPSLVVEGNLEADGRIGGSTYYFAGTGYIPVTATYPYQCFPLSGSQAGARIAWYDSAKAFLSLTAVENTGPQFAPAGAAFARVAFPQSWEVASFAAFADPDALSPYGYQRQWAKPVYGDDLAVEFSKENGEQFFRRGLNGKLTFCRADADFIAESPFDTRFVLLVEISYDGQTWAAYWRGYFYKTDCEFQPGLVIVQPSVEDEYTKILAGIDKEFDLIKLAPAIESLTAKKRPVVQLYFPGKSVIGCVLSGMYWEDEVAEAVSSESDLQSVYHFAKVRDAAVALVSGHETAFLTDESYTYDGGVGAGLKLSIDANGSTIRCAKGYSGSAWYFDWLANINGTSYAYRDNSAGAYDSLTLPASVTLTDSSDNTIDLEISVQKVYGRLMHDVDAISGAGVYDIPTNDIAGENLNYSKVTPWNFPDMVYFYGGLSDTPTQYGKYGDQYYQKPWIPGSSLTPVCRTEWERLSVWFNNLPSLWSVIETAASKEFTFRDCYPLNGVISALLGQIDTKVRFDADSAFSAFFYGNNPIKQDGAIPLLIPKSNVIKGEYDQPAQQAPVTLRRVLDMLRDCFRCYWFVEDGKLRIEHIKYFMNGGSYNVLPSVGIDLTRRFLTRVRKPWAFGQDNYKYDKPTMPERYEFSWMDKQTDPFNGLPIEIQNGYVQPGNIEKVSVADFSADIDYIMLNPSDISEDGFVLLMAVDGAVPTETLSFDGATYKLQNPFASFAYLQRFYLYDLPAPAYSIGGQGGIAIGTQRYKESEATFPALTDPDTKNLVKTNIGDGQIDKLSITLQGRTAKATLKYDTE